MADAHQPEEPAAADVEVVEVSRSKVKTTRSERTPLLSKPEEEVYPLPWFRSPEWTRHPPRPQETPDAADKTLAAAIDLCMPFGAAVLLQLVGVRRRLRVGIGLPRAETSEREEADEEADSFKQCIQFLVGLILIMAMALILLIIFQPKPDSSR
ncbi:hypothetical protein GQ600_11900 [Phytophthora cactorum]|nr:hypothetical protein GQ600_11900 [Phytophthora cactorum]